MAKTIKELTDKVYADTIKLIKENHLVRQNSSCSYERRNYRQ